MNIKKPKLLFSFANGKVQFPAYLPLVCPQKLYDLLLNYSTRNNIFIFFNLSQPLWEIKLVLGAQSPKRDMRALDDFNGYL